MRRALLIDRLRHIRDVLAADADQQPQQQEGDGGGREPFPPGAAFSFGFTHFVCHSAHLNVM